MLTLVRTLPPSPPPPWKVRRNTRRRAHRRVQAPVVTPARQERWHSGTVLALALVASVVLHVIIWSWWGGKPAEKPVENERITVAVVEKTPPPPPPPPEVPLKPEKLVKPISEAPPPKVHPDVPPPPNVVDPKASDKPPVLIAGISLSSTSSQGSFKVAVGNTLYGKPSTTPAPPEEVKPYKAAEYAPPHLLSEPPEFLNNVDDDTMRRFYPEEARKAEIEGVVRVRLTVDDDGSVALIKLIEDPGHGFGAAARKLARLYRFKPARVNGRVVATEIPFTVRFELR